MSGLEDTAVGQKVSHLREFLERRRTGDSSALGASTRVSNKEQSKSCEHASEILTRKSTREVISNPEQLNPANESAPRFSDLANDYKTIELKAQVLRAFLKPKNRQTKRVSSDMELWDHVDVLEEKPVESTPNEMALVEIAEEFQDEQRKETIHKVQDENSQLRRQVAVLTDERDNLLIDLHRQSSLKTEIQTLKSTIGGMREEIEERDKAVNQLQNTLAALQTVKLTDQSEMLRDLSRKFDLLLDKQQTFSRELTSMKSQLKSLSTGSSGRLHGFNTQGPSRSELKENVLNGNGSLTSTMNKLIQWMQETTEDIRLTNQNSIKLLSAENNRLRNMQLSLPMNVDDSSCKTVSVTTDYKNQLQNCVTILRLLRATVLKW